jgi:hypothetical protein
MDQMMKDCALTFSTKGDMTLAQRHLFIGIIFDTHQGRMFIAAEKFAKLMTLLREIMELVTCSPRNMSKLRGKAQHHFRCLEGVRPLLVGFDRFIGGPGSMYEWDKEAEIGPHLRSNMGFLYQQLPRLLEAGAEMWPMDPTMLYSGGQGGCRTRTASSSWQRGTRRSRGWPFRCVFGQARYSTSKACASKGCRR